MFDIKQSKPGIFYRMKATVTWSGGGVTKEDVWIWRNRPDTNTYNYVHVDPNSTDRGPHYHYWEIDVLEPEWCRSFEQVNPIEQLWLEGQFDMYSRKR